MDKIEPEPMSGCWLWSGAHHNLGYGLFRYQGKVRKAHRVSYEVIGGKKIPEGLTLDHACRVRCCVNPDHLTPMTLAENVMRGNGMGARHARKTHCVNGHELTGTNLIVWYLRRGERKCRACRDRQQGEYRRRKKEQRDALVA